MILYNRFIQVLDDLIFLPGETDFKLPAFKILQKKPEFIFIFENSENTEQITKRIKSLNPKQKVSGYLAFDFDLSFFGFLPTSSSSASGSSSILGNLARR